LKASENTKNSLQIDVVADDAYVAETVRPQGRTLKMTDKTIVRSDGLPGMGSNADLRATRLRSFRFS
jgi:hypothetical protein